MVKESAIRGCKGRRWQRREWDGMHNLVRPLTCLVEGGVGYPNNSPQVRRGRHLGAYSQTAQRLYTWACTEAAATP